MRYLLTVALAVLAAFATPALGAERVAKYGPSELRIMDSPCVSAETLGHIHAQYHAQFQAARAMIPARSYAGCWIEEGGVVFLIFENGESMTEDVRKFRDHSL